MRISKSRKRDTLRPHEKFDRLNFLRSFLHGLGVTNSEVSKVLKCTTANVSYVLAKKNDISLSRAERIVSNFGYELELILARNEEQRKFFTEEKAILAASRNNVNRMLPVKLAMDYKGITFTGLAKATGLWATSIRNWFNADDIYVSRLYQIARAIDCDVYWTIVPRRLETVNRLHIKTSVFIEKEDIL